MISYRDIRFWGALDWTKIWVVQDEPSVFVVHFPSSRTTSILNAYLSAKKDFSLEKYITLKTH